MIIVLTLSMTGSILPYRGGLRDSKVIETLRINKIQLLPTTSKPVSLPDSLDRVNIANNPLPRIICSALFVLTTMAAHGGAIVGSDPENWLTEAEAAYDRVESYTAIFHKQQRISGKLLPEENIFLKCRKKPFSLYMKWVTKPFKDSELLYVVGWNEDRVRAHRGGILRIIVRNLDPNAPVLMENDLRPGHGCCR